MAKERKHKVEWSFDFESVGDRISQFVTDMVDDEVEVEYFEFFEPRDGAASARIEIDFSVGAATLSALDADSENIFEGRIHTVGECDYAVSGGAERQISLRQRGSFPQGIARVIGKDKRLNWDIRLARDLPCQLRMRGGVGECVIDLSHLLMDTVDLETGLGKIDLTLPARHSKFAARIIGGVGKTDIVVPAGSAGHLVIKGGVGEVTVGVSPQAALRLKAKTGLGQVNLPNTLVRQQGKDEFLGISGVWETAGFAMAEQQTLIEYDGGIGSLQIKTFDLL